MSSRLKVGDKAPSFSASSTQGLVNLKNYEGKWVILLCNPSEFNNWRKNEIISLVKYAKAFKEKNTELITLSMDKKASHLQWFYAGARLGSYAMPFPIVDDRLGEIGKLYGVETSENASTETHLFIITPDQTLAKSFTVPNFGIPQVGQLMTHLTALQDGYRPQIQSLENQPPGTNPLCDNVPIVGEYVLGNPNNVDALLLDFVIYAFALINADGTLQVYSERYLRELVNLKLENPNLLVILGIGGWGADGFSDAALTPSSRYAFAREVQRWVNEYTLDGVDIDWEYPGSSAAGIKSRREDKENFTLLLTALRDVLGDEAWISVAGTGEASYINNVQIAEIAPIINYFNLMAYDFTAGETGATAGRHQSNLYPSDLSLSNMTSVDNQVQNLINAGMPSEQILMGLPFYGRYGATSTRTFDELRKDYINKNGYTVRWDNIAKAPYIVDPDGDFAYSYDNLLSIYFKGLYVIENCLGGLFAWQSGMDKANILAQGMSQAIRSPEVLEDLLAKAYYQALEAQEQQT
ncbi:glycosyl hydrolase family 18 protein [Cellulosilyticum lentocellum]|uniref:chitinase n=1 Tax=Cellulosilyticum lentocellum (strain ATCC 49066 / DSM 5427 / NCIMB 11756 / RHM5) TaxID=642492 RepID=F2JLJ6_CELLD|nr:glycosyl hydrolase family 18 protein [Cellulosilyticum lentocellum]ADZ83387.1 glycoside hydrolase family 18 [Cellulosilyticum lentocellum DSM 5427]